METVDNGKAIRETLNADIPLAADHFRYFAGAIRTQEGGISQIDNDTVAYHFHEPLGVVGQIIPWNFPILMAAWKLAPALAAGNCVVLKPAEQTPGVRSWCSWASLAICCRRAYSTSSTALAARPACRWRKASALPRLPSPAPPAPGRVIAQAAANSLIPATLELGGKSPNIFFADVMDKDDSFLDKAIEGLVLFAFNQGEVCTCPSRALIHESIYEKFMERVLEARGRHQAWQPAGPQLHDGRTGQQGAADQNPVLPGPGQARGRRSADWRRTGPAGRVRWTGGYYVQPTIFKGHNKMRIFQEEIFGPVLAVTTFKTEAEALELANDTLYGLGAGVWSRNGNVAYRMGRGIKAGRVWTNCYHHYPAHAAFGGYKESGVGRENHKMMLNHYQQTKNLLVSYSESKLGFF